MWRRLDLDSVLNEEERIPCVFEYEASGLGFLDATGEHADLNEGARVELPLFMAQHLTGKNFTKMELPKHYNRKMRDNILAGAASINLKDFSQYFFEVGMKISKANEDEDLHNTLRLAFCGDRYRALMSNSLSISNEENTDFANDLTVREQEIFYAGVTSAREVEEWRKQRSALLKKSGILSKRTYSAAAADSNNNNNNSTNKRK